MGIFNYLFNYKIILKNSVIYWLKIYFLLDKIHAHHLPMRLFKVHSNLYKFAFKQNVHVQQWLNVGKIIFYQ